MDFIFIKPPSITKPHPPELNFNPPPSIAKPSAGYKKMLSCSVLYVCKSAEREKLQLLRPLQVCRERETAATKTASSLQRKRNCSYYDPIVILYHCTTTTDPPSIVNPPYPGPAINQGGGVINRKLTLVRIALTDSRPQPLRGVLAVPLFFMNL